MTEIENEGAESQRYGGTITTFTGIEYYPCDPRPGDVCLEDIAHSLAFKYRWNSHSVRPVGVGWHSIQVMKLIVAWSVANPDCGWTDQDLALVMKWALFHDAHEAYLADIPTKVKPFIHGWYDLETLNDKAIFEHFGLDLDNMPLRAKEALLWADKAMGGAEGRALTKRDPTRLKPSPSPLQLLGSGVVIDPELNEDWRAVKREFISCYELLEEVLKESNHA